MRLELIVIVVAVVLLLPPIFAACSAAYYPLKFWWRRRQISARRSTEPETYKRWSEEWYRLEHRKYVFTICTLKAWGFIIGMNLFWNGANSWFALYLHEEKSVFPLILSGVGFVIFVLLALIWWIMELVDQ